MSQTHILRGPKLYGKAPDIFCGRKMVRGYVGIAEARHAEKRMRNHTRVTHVCNLRNDEGGCYKKDKAEEVVDPCVRQRSTKGSFCKDCLRKAKL
jgi:hypothetical protein